MPLRISGTKERIIMYTRMIVGKVGKSRKLGYPNAKDIKKWASTVCAFTFFLNNIAMMRQFSQYSIWNKTSWHLADKKKEWKNRITHNCVRLLEVVIYWQFSFISISHSPKRVSLFNCAFSLIQPESQSSFPFSRPPQKNFFSPSLDNICISRSCLAVHPDKRYKALRIPLVSFGNFFSLPSLLIVN